MAAGPRESPGSDLYWETQARALGYRRIAGLDEAGRGSLAGPVVAAVVVLPEQGLPEGIRDSKQLTPQRREALYLKILNVCPLLGVGVASSEEVDTLNVLNATRLAMKRALVSLPQLPEFLLIDAVALEDCPLPHWAISRGDCQSRTIAAASIVAKVTRDRLMGAYHHLYPQYGLDRHKGYGTREHLCRIQQHGPSALHRKTFLRRFAARVESHR